MCLYLKTQQKNQVSCVWIVNFFYELQEFLQHLEVPDQYQLFLIFHIGYESCIYFLELFINKWIKKSQDERHDSYYELIVVNAC